MKNNKLRLSGTMLSFLIIIISFIYAINIQPKVIGDYENLKEESKVISDSGKKSLINPDIYGILKFKGTYIYKFSIDDAFEYHSKITHLNENVILDDKFQLYLGSSIQNIIYSYYLKNILYTISMIKISNFYNLNEINSIKLR